MTCSSRIWIVLLAVNLTCQPVQANEPDQIRPSTGTVAELRTIVAEAARTVGEQLDKGHDWLYRRLQYSIEDVDTQFSEVGAAPIVVPVSAVRFGFGGDILHGQRGFDFDSTRDFEATLRVPNLERRLKVFITSGDLPEAPGEVSAKETAVRAGLRFVPISHVELEFGGRARVWPSAFAALRWTDEFRAGSVGAYPFLKTYAESGIGLGVSGGLALERWSGRWVLRSASYANWVRNTSSIDWTQTLMFGYARAVIQQRRYDRLADGHDLACGIAARLAVVGDRISRTSRYEASVLFKRPLRGGWLFGYAGPLVRWDRNTNWHPDAGIALGVDVLFWGLASPSAEVANFCG
jgi:hypothetical protein